MAAEHASDAAGTPATGQQIARVVQQQFPTYDADSSGTLNPAEFASWMTVLRKASEPGFEPDAPEAKAWMAQAFAIADADKSASLSQAEVANFLSQGSKTPS